VLCTPTPESSVAGSVKCTLLSQAEDIHTAQHIHIAKDNRSDLRPITPMPAWYAGHAGDAASPDETAGTPLCTGGPLMKAPCRHGEAWHCKTSYQSLYGSASLNSTGRGYISFLLVTPSWCGVERSSFPQIEPSEQPREFRSLVSLVRGQKCGFK
jgi:hypothetical protein